MWWWGALSATESNSWPERDTAPGEVSPSRYMQDADHTNTQTHRRHLSRHADGSLSVHTLCLSLLLPQGAHA